MAVFAPLMPLDDAWAQLRQAVQSHMALQRGLEVGRVPSLTALGRVLAESVVSPVQVPPLDNSAMDGYALCVADLDATHALPVSQRIAAGQVGQALASGTCARIFTGAPIPPGADAVVMQEHTELQADGTVMFTQPVVAGQNIRSQGEDIALGQTVLKPGLRLQPASLGVAASVGRDLLAVYRRPRVAVLTTGNELVMPGQELPPGGLFNSNRHTLSALGQAVGAQVADFGIVPDDLDSTREALADAAQRHDLIITSGGVSVGEEDHLRAAVEAEGGLQFWALAIKPGKPFVFGWIARADGSRCLYMGLPGNPSASFVTFLLLVRPVLGVLAGEPWALPRAVSLVADFDWPHADKRREFIRVRLGESGQVQLHPHQGSGVLSSAAWADGLVDLPPGHTVARGDRVNYLSLAECLQPACTQCQD